MRKLGKIVDWNDNRGFGFIVPEGGGDRVFVHIKAFRPGQARPRGGDLVDYVPTTDDKDRRRADDVVFAKQRPGGGRSTPAGSSGGLFTVLMAASVAFLLLLGWLAFKDKSDWAVTLVYLVMSAVSFVIYASDKAAAPAGGRRVPENTLHLLALLGGWPGALIAQRLLSHKTRKAGFQTLFWITVALNLAALAWYLLRMRG